MNYQSVKCGKICPACLRIFQLVSNTPQRRDGQVRESRTGLGQMVKWSSGQKIGTYNLLSELSNLSSIIDASIQHNTAKLLTSTLANQHILSHEIHATGGHWHSNDWARHASLARRQCHTSSRRRRNKWSPVKDRERPSAVWRQKYWKLPWRGIAWMA